MKIEVFAQKIRALRGDASLAELSQSTGISESRLGALESGSSEPTGDEVLILAQNFHREFEYLLDDSLNDPDENVVKLLRSEGASLTSADHAAIREFMFLCKSEAHLESLVGTRHTRSVDTFQFRPTGTYYKGHGQKCAVEFRRWLGMQSGQVDPDVYKLFRSVGIRIFRRTLPTRNVSALYVRHPSAGACILVNFTEDYFRQRFSAAHECGHALLDKDSNFNVTRIEDLERDQLGPPGRRWSKRELIEIRANIFATDFLIPEEYTSSPIHSGKWEDPQYLLRCANQLYVTVPALLKALWDRQVISTDARARLRSLGLTSQEREDPEFPSSLTDRQFERRLSLLTRGLSSSYIQLCFDAYEQNLITRGKLSDCMLTDQWELAHIAEDFGRSLRYE